jgi:hypothetical protein
MCGVFNNPEIVAPGDRNNGIHLTGHTCIMHGNNRPGARRYGGLDQPFIQNECEHRLVAVQGRKYRKMSNRMDLSIATAFMAAGGALGTLVLFKAGNLYFYQAFMPEMVYWACGFGLLYPIHPPPLLLDFLFGRLASLDCAALTATPSLGTSGYFFNTHLYLGWSVSTLWRLTSVNYRNLWPLFSILVGGYACGCFVLLRLFFGRWTATAGALVLMLSPVALSMIVYLRDYAKAPFFIWTVVLLILALRARNWRMTIIWTFSAGVVLGIGSGFRSDIIILLPVGIGTLALGIGPRAVRRCAIAIMAFVIGALFLASPILSGGSAGGFGIFLMQGLSEPFRISLGLGAAPYDFGAQYSDELTLSSVAADLRPSDPDWDGHEGPAVLKISQSITRSGPYVIGWLPYFASDVATQALKSAAWIIGFPALVAPGRQGLDPAGPVRAGPPIALHLSWLYDLLAQTWLPFVCGFGLLVFFLYVAASTTHEALALFQMFAAFLLYPVIQFSVRHVFHLEFIWVISVLALIRAPFEWAALRRVLPLFLMVVGVVAISGLAIRTGLKIYQDKALHEQFESVLAQPKETIDLASPIEKAGKTIFNVPLPERYRSLVASAPDSMNDRIAEVGAEWEVRAAADRLMLTLGGAKCPVGKLILSFHYAKRDGIWQPLDHDLVVEMLGDHVQDTLVLTPAYYRPTQYFSDIQILKEYAGCLVRIERLEGHFALPNVLTAVLTPGWKDRPLRRGFGGFPLTAGDAR